MSMSDRETILMQDIGSTLRYRLRGWRGLVAAAVILAVPALWFGWPWLVAAGLAPLILAMAPCAVMCAAGLCMNRVSKKPAVSANGSQGAADTALQIASAGAEPEQSPSLGACCADRESSTETNAPHSPAQSIQTKQKEMIQ